MTQSQALATTDARAPLALPAGPYEELVRLSDGELERIFRASSGPEPMALSGYEWRGFNTPRWTKLLGIQKFIKGFLVSDGAVEGYNIRVRQNGLSGAWQQLPSPDAPATFGYFTVKRVGADGGRALYPGSTLLNYGESRRNRWYRIDDMSMRVLRDFVVQPDPKNPDLMIGKAYMQLGPIRLYSNFFVIERLREAVWKPSAPKALSR
jgi:hypothetical protein